MVKKIKREEMKDVATLLYKLYNQDKFDNKGHTPIENAIKGFPKHKRGRIKELIEILIRKGLIVEAKHKYGRGISLRFSKIKEIEEIIERYH